VPPAEDPPALAEALAHVRRTAHAAGLRLVLKLSRGARKALGVPPRNGVWWRQLHLFLSSFVVIIELRAPCPRFSLLSSVFFRVGVYAGSGPEAAARAAQGFDLVVPGTDVGYLGDGARAAISSLKIVV